MSVAGVMYIAISIRLFRWPIQSIDACLFGSCRIRVNHSSIIHKAIRQASICDLFLFELFFINSDGHLYIVGVSKLKSYQRPNHALIHKMRMNTFYLKCMLHLGMNKASINHIRMETY